jgi:hypothetical protein
MVIDETSKGKGSLTGCWRGNHCDAGRGPIYPRNRGPLSALRRRKRAIRSAQRCKHDQRKGPLTDVEVGTQIGGFESLAGGGKHENVYWVKQGSCITTWRKLSTRWDRSRRTHIPAQAWME